MAGRKHKKRSPVRVGEITHIGVVQHGFVREVSFPIRRGEVTFLFGQNNSGKSTILDAVRTLGGGPRREPSWVIAYARDGDVKPAAYEDAAWLDEWTYEISKDVGLWFDEVEVNPTVSVRGWVRGLRAKDRDRFDELLGVGPRTCFSTAWGPRVGNNGGLVVWTGVSPDPLATPVETSVPMPLLMMAVPGSEAGYHGSDSIGPPDAMAAMPEEIRQQIEAWSDEYFAWEEEHALHCEGDPSAESRSDIPDPPAIPEIAFTPDAAPFSWLINPSRLIPTLDTLIGPTPFGLSVVTADQSIANSREWPELTRHFFEVTIEAAARRLSEIGHAPPTRIVGLGFCRRAGRLVPHPIMEDALPAIARRATEFIPEFARHSPSSQFVLAPLPDSGSLEFFVEDTIDGRVRRLRIDELAEGLRLWHALAIRLALTPMGILPAILEILGEDADIEREAPNVPGDETILILDEPERHLHPGAQREAARWLADFAEKTGSYVIAATHSPAFLSSSRGRYLHVERHPDSTIDVRELEAIELRKHLRSDRALGLDRGELLSFYDNYLVVEGEHEQIILEAWFPEELARTLICPMRGTNRLESVNLQLESLMRIVRMPVGFLVDDDPIVRGVVECANELQDIPPGKPRIELAKATVPGFKERRHRSWLDVLFFDHVTWASPIQVVDEPDIIFYLDEDLIGMGAKRSYTHAAAKHALAHEKGDNSGIKPFLERHFSLRDEVFSESEVGRMARASSGPGRNRLADHVDLLLARLSEGSDK